MSRSSHPTPLTHTNPQATTADITAADLMTRLYIYADDSDAGARDGNVGTTFAPPTTSPPN